jgi:hypothetical protein
MGGTPEQTKKLVVLLGKDFTMSCPIVKESLADKEISTFCPLVKETLSLSLKNTLCLSGYSYVGLKREVIICLIRMRGNYAFFVMTPMKDLITKFQPLFTNLQIRNLIRYMLENSGCYFSSSSMNECWMKSDILWRLRTVD